MPIQENLTNPLKVALHNTYEKLATYFKLYHNDPNISARQTCNAQFDAVKALLDCERLHNETLPNNILKACSVFITTKIDKQFAPHINLENLKKEIYCYTWATLKEFNIIAKNEGNESVLLHDNPMLIDALGAVDICLSILNGQLPAAPSINDTSSITVLEIERDYLSRWYRYDETVDKLQVMFEHINKGVALQHIQTENNHAHSENITIVVAHISGETKDTNLDSDVN